MYDPHATPPLSVRAQEALRRTLGRGGAFLDVGATIGATSLVAAAIVGPEGSVTAVDPQRGCVAALRANAVRNGFAQMRGKNEAFCDAMEALDYRVVDLAAPGEVRTGGGNTHAFCEPR